MLIPHVIVAYRAYINFSEIGSYIVALQTYSIIFRGRETGLASCFHVLANRRQLPFTDMHQAWGMDKKLHLSEIWDAISHPRADCKGIWLKLKPCEANCTPPKVFGCNYYLISDKLL